MTRPERILWSYLKEFRKSGIVFRRQHTIPPYIVDFACSSCRLVIELDGNSHTDQEDKDERRSAFLESQGWTVQRFTYDDIFRHALQISNGLFETCIAILASQNQESVPPPPPGEDLEGGVLLEPQSQDFVPPPPPGEDLGGGKLPEPESLGFAPPPPLGEDSRRGKIQKLSDLLDHPALAKIKLLTTNNKFENQIYIVGGAIRDALLNRPQKNDFDLVTEQDAIKLAEFLHKADPKSIPSPQIYARFGTAMLHIAGVNIELITARRESYSPDSRKPNIEPATLADDALRRDFTINTLLVNLHSQELLDPIGVALDDLHNQIIRTPLDPHQTFSDDPLRMLRAVRFKHQLGFTFLETFENPIKGNTSPPPLGRT
ncbi:hypothetical protein CCB80_04320 [Armatimonadetes bacterium Uphvl-Ar1]|nr:hypothetical protein CCB80_04320 [Armatimonadetes bacterium Uphvl-Ar1]